MGKNTLNHRIFTLNCRGRIVIIDQPLVMGIINLTPDSFYEGSRFDNNTSILRQFEKMLSEGADIVDVGGQSTRPGSARVSEEEELSRVMPVIELLSREFPEALISIDSFYSKVASEAVITGACFVNDISGGTIDKQMLTVVGGLNVPYICMHTPGTPDVMQQQAHYENVTRDVLDFFIQRSEACRIAGIKDVIFDPGMGFGKTIRHNFDLLKNLSVFRMLERPLLFGISRKSTIYKTLGTSAAQALNGTTVLNSIGLMNGADILRVHDVKEAKEAVILYQEYRK